MGRPASNRPTDAELEILQVFWKRGIATVRDIHDDLGANRKVAYTSIATIVRIMIEKDMVQIVDARRPQKFKATISEEQARKDITDDWLKRLFNGSVVNLMRHALTSRKCTGAEKQELMELVEQSTKLAPRFVTQAPLSKNPR